MMAENRLVNPSPLKTALPTKTEPALRIKTGSSHAARPALLQDRHSAHASRVKNVLVPLDGSAFAEQAIPLALGIAEQCGAVLHLVHVLVPVDVLGPYDALYSAGASLAAIKREKRRYLRDLIEKISASSSALVASRVIDGRAVSSSLHDVPGLDTDLVVMATHGRGTLGRFWSGSVAHSLLQRMSAPVILVRGADTPVTFNAKTIAHVLLPLDGSEASENVLRPMLDLGIFPDARHSLLHSVPLAPKHVVRHYALHTEWVPSRRRWMAGMQYLHPLARALLADGRIVHTKVVSSDEPFGQVVLRAAEQDDVSLIALAYRRQSPLARLLWPNTSEYLFRDSSRPVMFVPAKLS
jgi:nucleotide-binding universal stress UspA family protein